jgi:glycogen synthase
MKILMLGWELPPHIVGGLGVACYELSKALAEQGVEIDFVVPYEAEHPGSEFMTVHCATDLGPLYHQNLGAYTGNTGGTTEPGTNPHGTDLRSIQKKYIHYVSRLAKKVQPQVIHAHDWLTYEAGIEAKRITGAPLVAHVHATEFDRAGSNEHGNPVIHDIELEGFMMADRIIAVSNITKQIIVNRYGIPADKIEVVHNSIDPASMLSHRSVEQNSYLYARTLQQEGYIVVAAMSRFTVQKGMTHFLQAAAKASKVIDRMIFLLAGDGEQRDELIALSADLGISDKVLFTGFVRGKRWREVYDIADVFVMSSVSEPFGLTALEAAAMDTSLVITHQSGVGEVLHNVLRYDYWDVDRLADQIVNLASSRALREDLSSNAKAEFMSMSWIEPAKKCYHQYVTAGAQV